MIDVVLVAPVRAYRDAFASAITREPGFRVVGQAATGAEALACMAPPHPAVALLDFGIDNVVAVLESLRRTAPRTRIIAVGIGTGRGHAEAVVRAAEAGVTGFVDSDQPLTDVLDAVRLAVCGQSPCSPRIGAVILQALQRRPAPPVIPRASRPLATVQPHLTAREALVADLAARGLTNRQIAARLMVGESTVKTHMHAALGKLGLKSRADLVLSSHIAPPDRSEADMDSPPTPTE
ncbi:LuxR C-terminal-related transcriptional regulator [Kribbella sp. NPDC055110]